MVSRPRGPRGRGCCRRQTLDLVERAVDEGFYPYRFLAEYCPFMEPLRGTPRFADILAKAQRRVEEFNEWEAEHAA